MTREEAIQFLDNMKYEEAGRAIGKDGFYAELMGYHIEALSMAIKALEQEPKTGHWIRVTDKTGHFLGWQCDKCGLQQRFNTNFCPDCGARMESEG